MRDVIVGTLSKKIEYCESFIKSLTRYHPYFKLTDVYVVDDTRLPLADLVSLSWAKGITWIPSLRPWGFSKNANYLIQAAILRQTDLLLCNDDTEFIHPNTIYALQQVSINYPNVGILSPIFVGGVGNEKQMAIKGQYKEGEVMVYEKDNCLCFVGVYLPYDTLINVGFLNEVFDAESYGWEDNEYCDRIKEAGLELGITPLVKMRHGKAGNWSGSTYRDIVNIELMVERGKALYKQETKRRKFMSATSLGKL